MNSSRVIIVGGGISGLSAGIALSERDIPVLVLDQKPALGGRAASFRDATTGDIVDNGQHVLIAGYSHTLNFLRRIGTLEKLSIQPSLSILFHHPEKGFRRLTLPRLPPPIHLLFGILSCRLWSFRDRLLLLRGGASLLRSELKMNKKLRGMTITQWLEDVAQHEELQRTFWNPLAIAIMNERPSVASAGTFAASLRKAFLSSRMSASIALPTTDLSELYVQHAAEFIMMRGGEIRSNADVDHVQVEETKVTGVYLRSDELIRSRAVILAVPPHKLRPLLPAGIPFDPTIFSWSPIVSVHLWFEGDFMKDDFVGIIGRTTQWLFNKSKINREGRKGGHVSAIISAAHDVVDLTNEEILAIVLADIRSVYPQTMDPAHSLVIREKRATYSSNPIVDQQRPGHKTSIENLYLAGDWTATGFPATIESAVISGERCAAEIV